MVFYMGFSNTMVFVEEYEQIAADWTKRIIIVFGCQHWIAQDGQAGRGLANGRGGGHHGWNRMESCSTCTTHRIQYQGIFGFGAPKK